MSDAQAAVEKSEASAEEAAIRAQALQDVLREAEATAVQAEHPG